MIRPMTCLSLLAALGAGLYLYQEKHNAQMLDRDITRTVKQADQARERIGLLKAEWALLNEPERLQGLASQHLQLQSLQPPQFARLEDLPGRLPAPSAVGVNAPPMDDAPVAAVQPAPAPIGVRGAAMLAQAAPMPTPMPAQQVMQARIAPPPAPPAAAPVQLAAAKPAPRPAAPHVLAAVKPHEAEPAPVVASVPAPRPVFVPVMPAYAPAPVVVHAPTVQTASAMAPMAPMQPAPFVGSALGMARSMLAAPVPVTASSNLGYASGR